MPNLRIPLFATRLLIAMFLLPWTLMRFTRPDAAKGVADRYYGPLGGMPDIVFLLIAVFMAALLLAFVTGAWKRISYGLVLLLHAVGTLTTVPYLVPGTENFNILFMAALPTIGAIWLLYVLREQDTFLSLG